MEKNLKMTTQEMIDVLKAYQEGKEIEVRFKSSLTNIWSKQNNKQWNFTICEYRVKPEIPVRKFRLIKLYPLSPSLGTIVEFKTEQDFNDGVENVGDGSSTYYLVDCVGFPEYWEEIIEEKYNEYVDLVGKKCYFENDLLTITSSNKDQIVINNYFNISREFFNKHYKLI